MAGLPEKINSTFQSIEDASANFSTSLPSVLTLDPNVDYEGMYSHATISGERWNKLYPYQLLVVEQQKDGGWKRSDLEWQITLPFPPTSLEIDMPFAITTSATLGGVVEEHNGAPFRLITMSGTTGVLPLKGAPEGLNSLLDTGRVLFGGILAGTVSAVSIGASDAIRASAGIIPNVNQNVVPEAEFSTGTPTSINRTTGYHQAHLLKEFFESFSEYKKKEAGRKLRLALAIWKDNSVFLVTPISYKTHRDAQNPYEYSYNLQFKAWGRINLDEGPDGQNAHEPLGRDPNALALLVRTIGAARGVLENARKVLQAVRADINNALFTPLREVMLAAKTAAGLEATLSDLPSNIITDSKESFLEIFGIESQTNTSTTPSKILDKIADRIKAENLRKLAELSLKGNTRSGRNSNAKSALAGASPTNKMFNHPEDNYDVFSKVDPARLKLPPVVQRQIRLEKERVNAFTRKDYEIRRDMIVDVMTDYANSVGLGSDTYTAVFGQKPKTTASVRVATDDDFDILYNLNQVVLEINRMCVSNKIDPEKTDAIEYIAGLARRSGISFTEPRSKYLVPYLFGHSLEQMALLYLGDASRWHEIATLNGLREPWIDEVGFDVPLAVNAYDSTVQVTSTTNLFVGQGIYISSAIQRPEKRRITGIKEITFGVHLITLDGEPDLSKFTVTDQARLHAYLPDTVNSQMSLYIPSQEDPNNDDWQVKSIPGVDYFDNLIRVGGISLLLNQSNDIIFTTHGQTRLAVGLTNIVQKARIALSTPKGALLQHPNYGLPVKVGDSTADVDAKNVLKSIQAMFSKDPSFSSITSASVLKKAGTTSISVNIGIAGTTQVVPITAEIRR